MRDTYHLHWGQDEIKSQEQIIENLIKPNLSLRQVFIQQFISTSQSKYGSHGKPNHIIIQICLPDGASKVHSYIPSVIRHCHCRWPSQLHIIRDLAPVHWELKASSSCGTIRRWGAHTPLTMMYFREIANTSQGSRSGGIILWVDKSSTYWREHIIGPSPQ